MFKAYATLRSEINRNFLGLLWWMIEPALYLGAFILIFSIGFRMGGEHYVVSLLIGLATWKWYSSCLVMGIYAITANKGLIDQTNINKMLFPLSMVITNTVKYIFVFIVLLVIMFASGYRISIVWLYLIPLFSIQFVYYLATACIVSSIIPFINDLGILINNMVILLFFISGVFYDISTLDSEIVKYILYINPVSLIIKHSRLVMIQNQSPAHTEIIYLSIISLLFLLLSIAVLNFLGKRYAKYI